MLLNLFFCFFLNFLSGARSILWSHWLLLFWTSCVLPHGFQIQSGYLACTLSCLHAVILKVTSGATPAFSTNRGVHCISTYMAWQPVTFPTCHVCNRGRLPGFDRETSRTVSRCALHSATTTGFIDLLSFILYEYQKCLICVIYLLQPRFVVMSHVRSCSLQAACWMVLFFKINIGEHKCLL